MAGSLAINKMDPTKVYYPKKKIPFLKTGVLAAVILIGGLFFIYYISGINLPNSRNINGVKFVIKGGESSSQISNNLKKHNLIKNDLIFELYGWQTGLDDKLQPGEYEIPQNLNIKDVIKILTTIKSKVIAERNLTIIEGWQAKDIAQYLEKENFGSTQDFMVLIQKKADWWDDYDFLTAKPKNVDLEGYLFPDTYRVYERATLPDITKKMLNNFNQKLTPELRQDISKQGKTIHEIITLASIIEKEVATQSDKKIVAGIFNSRLKLGMPLQSDATVNYLTGKKTVRPTLDDLSFESLYNTYKYAGLPPGPICNPGLSSIQAAIYPAQNPYYYFLNTPDGQVIFSKTYSEHLKAKAKYWQ